MPERDTFHGGAREVAGFKSLRVHAEPNAGAVGHIGGAFPFEIGEQQQAVRARGDAADFGGKPFV